MTAAVDHMDDLLGPEPTVDETTPAEQSIETPVAEQQVEHIEPVDAEQPVQDAKPDPETLVNNYKNMAHQERMERKQLQEQMRVMQDRFEQLITATQPQQPEEPVYDEDPLGATYNKLDKVSQTVEQLQAEAANRQQMERYQGFVNSVKQDEASFLAKQPDYTDAVTFLQSRRVTELQAMGYPEDQAMQVLAQDAIALTARAKQLGESPAAFAYKMAKSLGYTAKQASNIDQIAAGQQVARSVAGGGNPVNEGALPPNLADMSDAEFETMFKKMTGAKR